MEEEIWEHLARHLELLAVSHTVVFLPFSDFIFQTIGCCSRRNCILIFCALLCISDSATSHFDLSMTQQFASSSYFLSVCNFILLVSVSTILSPSVFYRCFYLISVFLHYSVSLFLTTPTLANPVCRLAETFLGIVNRCLQHCADMSWSTVLQLWKSTGHNPVKQSNQKAEDTVYCTVHHHMALCDAPLNPKTIKNWKWLIWSLCSIDAIGIPSQVCPIWFV